MTVSGAAAAILAKGGRNKPTALSVGPDRFFFWSYDCSEPRHVHVRRDRLQAKFRRLAYGTPEERGHFIVFRDSLHWPDLDEDIGLPTLLLGRGLGESPQSLQHWLEERQKGREPASTSA